MSIRFEFDSDIGTSRSGSFDFDKRLISKEKKKLIDKEIRDFLRKQGAKGHVTFAQVVPKGNTGKLAEEGLEVSTVKRGPFGFKIDFSVEPVITDGDIAEWYYPFYVHEGTASPIKPQGNVLGLRDKNTGFVFSWREQVAGQKAQPYMTDFTRVMNKSFGLSQYYLGKKIEQILRSRV
jgi:hypothetical protein